MGSSSRSFFHDLLVLAVVTVLGLALAYHPVLLSGFSRTPGDLGDARLVHYILENGWRWLRQVPLHASFWDPPIFFPEKNTSAYTDILLSAGPPYWIWRVLGVAPDRSFQLWHLTVASSNSVAAFLLLRAGLRFTRVPAAAGAFIFAFSASRVGQLNHPQLLIHCYALLSLLGLARLWKTEATDCVWRRIGWALVFTLGASAELWASFYLGWFHGFALLVLAASALCVRAARERLLRALRAHWIPLAVAGVAGAVTAFPLASHFMGAARELGFRSFENVVPMLPNAASWLFPGQNSWLYGWMAQVPPIRNFGMQSEHALGIGFFTLSLVVLGYRAPRLRAELRLIGIASLAILALTSVLPAPFSPWRAVFHFVPGAAAIRALSRIGLLMLIPAAIGLAAFFQERKGWKRITLFATLVLIEQGQRGYVFETMPQREEIHRIAAAIGPECRSFYYGPAQAPFYDAPDWKLQVDAMWAGLEAGIPSVNGYSGNAPRGWTLGDPRVRSAADATKLDSAIREWETRHGLPDSAICRIKAPARQSANRGY